ncbi:hypothetical protein [Marinobacter sp. PE14]
MLQINGLQLLAIAGLINFKNWFGVPVETLPVVGVALPDDLLWRNVVLYGWFAIGVLIFIQPFLRNGFSEIIEDFKSVTAPHYEGQAVMEDHYRLFSDTGYEPGIAVKFLSVLKFIIWYPVKLIILSPIFLGLLLPVLCSISAVLSILLA